MIRVAAGVKPTICSWWSTNSVPIPVPARSHRQYAGRWPSASPREAERPPRGPGTRRHRAVHRGEQVSELTHGLGGAEEEEAAGVQCIVEDRDDPPVQRHAHVDEEVPAGDQVEPGWDRALFLSMGASALPDSDLRSFSPR